MASRLNVLTGFRAIDERQLALMRALCATRWQIFVKLRLPSLIIRLQTEMDVANVFVGVVALAALVGVLHTAVRMFSKKIVFWTEFRDSGRGRVGTAAARGEQENLRRRRYESRGWRVAKPATHERRTRPSNGIANATFAFCSCVLRARSTVA